MTDADTPANQQCSKVGRVSARRRLFGFFALMVLLILGWFGWEQWQLVRLQAAAPVVSVADDGRVYINGVEIVIGTDGLPPKALEEVLGGPPEELPPQRETEMAQPGNPVEVRIRRSWRYPQPGPTLHITHEHGLGTLEPVLQFDSGHPGTVDFRGRRTWLGPEAPFSRGVAKADLNAMIREGDLAADTSVMGAGKHRFAWVFKSGPTVVELFLEEFRPLRSLHMHGFIRHRLEAALIVMPAVSDGTPRPPVGDPFAPSAAPDELVPAPAK